jgi:hypothetical protein
MKKFKKLTVAALVVVGTLAPAAAASAAIKDGVCQGGEVCMYNGTQATGSIYDNDTGWDGNLSNNDYPGTGTSVNNTIGSIQNLSTAHMEFHTGFNFVGDSICLPPGTATSFGAAPVAHMNNAISSHKSRSSC